MVGDEHKEEGAHPAATRGISRVATDLSEHEVDADKRFDTIEQGIAVLLDRSGGRATRSEKSRQDENLK